VIAQKRRCRGLTFLIVPAGFVREVTDMGYPSCLEHDVERRSANEARTIYEWQHPQVNVKHAVPMESSAHRRRAVDVPSPQIKVRIFNDVPSPRIGWFTIFPNDGVSPVVRRELIIT
jgi:hypothetical protein